LLEFIDYDEKKIKYCIVAFSLHCGTSSAEEGCSAG
jgi:hypothetical protein